MTVELIDEGKTNVNLTVNYSQDVQPSVHDNWIYVEAELFTIDNLGNEYQLPYNGDSGMEIPVKISHGTQRFMVLTRKQHLLRFSIRTRQ